MNFLFKVFVFLLSFSEIIAIPLQICAKSRPGNVIISPLSVANSLALLSQAANSNTFDKLRQGLHLNGSDKLTIADQFNEFYGQLQHSTRNLTLSIANQIYVQKGHKLNASFQEVTATKFRSGVKALNFDDTDKSSETINHFVEEKTHGKIRNFIKSGSLNGNIVLFLLNVIYFKGNWEHKFNKEHTREDEFYIRENETAPTAFMTIKKKFNYAKLQDLDASVLEMKYANSTLSFFIILPYSRAGLTELEAKLRDYDLKSITKQMHPRKIDVTIPKFKIDYEIELSAVLKDVRFQMQSCFFDLNYFWVFTNNTQFPIYLDGNDRNFFKQCRF